MDDTDRPVTQVVVVTGPPCSGKSILAPLLARRLGQPAVCIEADWFWTTISTGFIPPWESASDHQNRTILRAVVHAAAEMADGGYAVVIDGIVGPWHLDLVAEVLADHRLDLDYIVLRPTLATCLARAIGRRDGAPRVDGHPPLADSGPISSLWNQFSDVGTYEHHVLDTTNASVEETLDLIMGALDGRTMRIESRG